MSGFNEVLCMMMNVMTMIGGIMTCFVLAALTGHCFDQLVVSLVNWNLIDLYLISFVEYLQHSSMQGFRFSTYTYEL